MYVICIEDDALFKGEGDVIPQLLSHGIMILHVTYVLLHYGLMIFYYDCGIMILFMINLIQDKLLMFDNMTLEFGTIINVNIITIIPAIFECC